ncbi:hypothetical protein IJG78_01530 [Candidatus Saccharibacteria bacterium]|nr:hypothetical protein [Candidatus Saccharibacteria bacterium]
MRGLTDDPEKTPVAKPKKPAPQATSGQAPAPAVPVAAPVPPLAVQAAPVSAQQSSGNGKAAMVSGSFVSPTNKGGDVATSQETGPAASEFIKATIDNDTEEDRKDMRNLDFYSTIGNSMYDFDRGLGMSAALRDWIKSAIKDDDDLAKQIVTENLAEILGQKPNLIPAVKGVLKDVAENHILYRACFVSKLDNKEYEDRADAEAAIEAYKAIGATFESSYTTVYRRVKPDGTAGQRVPLDQVKAYVDKFDGDREALKRRLYIADEAPDQTDKFTGSAPAAPGSTTAMS